MQGDEYVCLRTTASLLKKHLLQFQINFKCQFPVFTFLLYAILCAEMMLLAIFVALLVAPPSLGVPVAQIVHCSQSTRFTVLTPMVIRAEYNQQGIFEDKPTQVFLFRDKAQASAPTFEVYTRMHLIIVTCALVVTVPLSSPPRCRTRQRGATSQHLNSYYHITSREAPPQPHQKVYFLS